MNNDDDVLSKLIEYIEQWLYQNQENQKAVKSLTDILEIYRWAKGTIDSMPPTVRGQFDDAAFLSSVDRIYTWLFDFVPPISPVNLSEIASTSITSMGITSNLLFEMSNKVTSESDKMWLSKQTDIFSGLQEKHDNIKKTLELLQRLDERIASDPILAAEYDLMVEKAFYYRGTELDKNVSAGIAMRNVHEHYKGKVMSLARSQPMENMTFETALRRLSIYPEGSFQASILFEQVATWSQLQKRLSNTAKNSTKGDIKQSAVELIAHIYTVLSLIRL